MRNVTLLIYIFTLSFLTLILLVSRTEPAQLLADGLLFLLQGKKATLHMVEATPKGFNELAKASFLSDKHAWAPMAMAAGRLIVRDFTEMVCLELPKGAAP